MSSKEADSLVGEKVHKKRARESEKVENRFKFKEEFFCQKKSEKVD